MSRDKKFCQWNPGTIFTICGALVSAGKTLEEIKVYVKTEDFSTQVRENFEKQVDISFFQTELLVSEKNIDHNNIENK